ncbi:2-dehydro-3-deoxyphosphogluconate aldolase [Halobacteriales archaeon QS_6_71_20]|nr:MAG: 2-dehydro-3-deoxyphosphogluconate aldolase [Halobacteriales archaeon QS_6_71_20]
MSTADAFAELRRSGVVAVLRGAEPETVVDTAQALLAGGVTALEVTADTAGSAGMIATLSEALGDEALVGAGTVLDGETASEAIAAGAEFVVSPSLDQGAVETCNRHGVLCAPGVMTPTEAVEAYEAGADLVKVFPAETVGPEHVAALKGPLGHVEIMPTGGVSPDDAGDYIEAGAVCVGAGSALVDRELVEAGDFGAITARAETFREVIERARE